MRIFLEVENGDYASFRNDPQRNLQLHAAAAYHTVTRPRTHRGPRSCPGDLHDNGGGGDTYFDTTLNHSFDSDTRTPRETMIHRRRRQQQLQRFRRANAVTSEYGSGDPSPTTLYGNYNPNLDDSDSDSWTAEYERSLHIRDLESRLLEQKKKLREYKEKLRAERDLRIVNERSMMEEVERYKRELRKEQRDRKVTEQRYVDVIAFLKTRLSVLERHQPVAISQRCPPPPPPLPILNDPTTINLHNIVQPPPGTLEGTGELLYPLKGNSPLSLVPKTADSEAELDETKNFRVRDAFGEVETARSSGDHHTTTSGTTVTEPSSEICASASTVLNEYDSDNDENGYVTTCEYFTKAIAKTKGDRDSAASPLRTSL